MMISSFACVQEFFAAFQKLLPNEREAVACEIVDFCKGYLDGKAENDRALFGDSDGTPQVLSKASGTTLVEMMNAAGCRPGFVNRGSA